MTHMSTMFGVEFVSAGVVRDADGNVISGEDGITAVTDETKED